jgi:predicted metalloprotease
MARNSVVARRLIVVAFVAVALGAPAGAASPGEAATRASLLSTSVALDAFWGAEFDARGLDYRPPHLVMETGPLESPCAGEAWFAAYCPIGFALHIDPADVSRRAETYGFGLGDLALAHEWTHHMVTILYADRALPGELAPLLANPGAEELLADCQAGAFVATWWRGREDEAARIDGARAFLADNASAVHGEANARTAAFDRGYGDGVVACGLFPPLASHHPGDPR